MANFAYGDGNTEQFSKETDSLARVVEILMRDQCVLNYRESYDKVNNEQWKTGEIGQKFKERLQDIDCLVKIALIITDQAET